MVGGLLPHHVGEGGVHCQLHYEAYVAVMAPTLWYWGGRRIGLEELHYFVDGFLFWLSFGLGGSFYVGLGFNIINRY